MSEPEQVTAPREKSKLPVLHLLPNLLTIAAICAGLTAIRFGYNGDFQNAVKLILFAGILDGLDGRLARLLRCQSSVGAELDSLADFLNFGVAPGLILHAWALHDFRGIGWIVVLVYTICCVLRLARFNVMSRLEDKPATDHFVGVPSPAGAMLALLPMYLAFLFHEDPHLPAEVIAAYLLVVGLMMIGRLPTPSFKNITIRREHARYLMVGAVLIASALFTYLWLTLVLASLAYIAGLVITFVTSRRKPA
ncbi:CDP-diacylglycerol--serine O-phosphatidyltransferase [Pacificoceanicola onchidii]|uniref:CDP-diacylglycerol--serine O-phosphatidyltransferase n=1 Tax=Pacificoceanicola onchidii TaxID=2562685 RepID=UPI0010A30E2C|nr:CDP-diacylglycerol--serine O-phosphatidyltransferase [Pacificoceanicola onchidii]